MASGGLKSLTFSLNSVLVIPEYISKTLANALNIPSPIEEEELGELANSSKTTLKLSISNDFINFPKFLMLIIYFL